MLWLITRRWWTLGGIFLVLLLGLVLFPTVLGGFPVEAILFLLVMAILMVTLGRRKVPTQNRPN